MDGQSKQHRSVPGVNQMKNLVKSNKESNEKNFRIQTNKPTKMSQDNRINSFRRQKPNGNDQSNAKPLLECIQPEPLLTSKPYEKSISQRRRRNEPFNDNHFGKFFISKFDFNSIVFCF